MTEGAAPRPASTTSGAPPTVSVIIPNYNQAHFLGSAIESVREQTYPHVETVVVDDGSPDDTPAVTSRYPAVTCIRQPNQGLCAARNTGMHASSGQYLVFLDADDMLLPHAIETGVRELQRRPDCALAAGRVQWIDVDGRPLPSPVVAPVEGDPVPQLLIDHCRIYPVAVVYRRAAVQAVGGWNRQFEAAEDWELTMRLVRRFPVSIHDRIVGAYRRHGANMSRDSRLMLASVLRVLRAQRSFVRSNPLYEQAYRQGVRGMQELLGDRVIEDVKRDLRQGSPRRALGATAQLLRDYPGGVAAHLGRKIRVSLSRSRRVH